MSERVSASTQTLSALVFLYRHVLGQDIGLLEGVVRAKRPGRVPVVLSPAEVRLLLSRLQGVVLLVCPLLYGSGLRLLECRKLRVKDIDFERNEVTVRDGKGRKDRVTVLPACSRARLLDDLSEVHRVHESDLRQGLGRAPLPDAVVRKYPSADRQWAWQDMFPASSHYTDRRTAYAIGIICTRRSSRRPWPRRPASRD